MMGVMKTLAIALEDGSLDNPQLDDARREGFNNSLVGSYDEYKYTGDLERAYRLGHLQYEQAYGAHNTMRYVK